jgi:DNA-binding MarR family transcriptional regulator
MAADMKSKTIETIDQSNLLVDLSTTYYSTVNAFEAYADIEMPEWRILYLIHRDPGCTQKRLIELIKVAPASITRQVKSLEADRFIRREADPVDNRLTRVFLTARGKAYVEKKLILRREFFKKLLHGLSEEDVDRFLATMQRMRENLQPVDPSIKQDAGPGG